MRRGRVVLLAGGVLLAGATVAYAAGLGLTSKRVTVLSTAAPTTTSSSSSSTTSTTTPANAMTITLGNNSKTAAQGDVVTITFNPAVKPETFCSGWTGSATSFNLGTGNNEVTITVNNGVAPTNDTVSVTAFSATCTSGFHLGTVNLGTADYVTQPVEFKGTSTQNNRSSVVWTPATRTMVLTLGGPGGTASARGTLTTAPTATFTPDAGLRDVNDNPVTGSASTGTTF